LMKEIVLLLVACANEAEAKKIACALVRGRFAVCVNVVPRVESVYRWKQRAEEASEALIIVKTTRSKAEAAKRKIRRLHSYELPSIVLLQASVANDVHAWFKESVSKK